MENYMEYHLMGSVQRVRMKPGCVPTKFGCLLSPTKIRRRLNILKKPQEKLIEECEKTLNEKIGRMRSYPDTDDIPTHNNIEVETLDLKPDYIKIEPHDGDFQDIEIQTSIDVKEEGMDFDTTDIEEPDIDTAKKNSKIGLGYKEEVKNTRKTAEIAVQVHKFRSKACETNFKSINSSSQSSDSDVSLCDDKDPLQVPDTETTPTSSREADIAVAGGSCSVLPCSSRGRRPIMRPRGSLPLRDHDIAQFLADSGSDEDSNASDEDEIVVEEPISRRIVSRLRRQIIREEEEIEIEELGDKRMNSEPMILEGMNEGMNEILYEGMNVDANRPDRVSTEFLWSDDFSIFSGQKETYRRDPGPNFISQDPTEIFLEFWDAHIMGLIADETNKYARQNIEMYTDPDLGTTIPKYLEQWEEVTIPVLYRYFAVMICMSFCVRSKIQEYWEKGLLEMPVFRQAMSRDEFLLITKFLHFVSDRDSSAHGYARKIGKIAPILDHCNQKFSALYVPEQHISLDESLLLWKGSLSWRQCIRSKAARFGIKSFDLCEATTGYLLKCKLYTGKETPMHTVPLHGFANKTAQVVLDLMEGYLDAGHVLVMDNWYNQLFLTRYLKSRCTDVLGTISRTRKNVPQELKDLNQNRVARGECHARHSGDIALVTWKDVKLVTVMSTYHEHEMVPGRRGVAREKPVSVRDYNKYMGGVDLKDQKLSTFLFERKRCRKWYMKVFRRLVNTSLLNAFIIYTKNPSHRVCSHREFRRAVAEGLLARFGNVHSLPPSVPNRALRLQRGNHYPVNTDKLPNKNEHKRMSCARCQMVKKRTQVRIMCSLCQVPLCIGQCWIDYHTLDNLSNARYQE